MRIHAAGRRARMEDDRPRDRAGAVHLHASRGGEGDRGATTLAVPGGVAAGSSLSAPRYRGRWSSPFLSQIVSPEIATLGASAGFAVDLVEGTLTTGHAPCPPIDRDPRRRRGGLLTPDGGG